MKLKANKGDQCEKSSQCCVVCGKGGDVWLTQSNLIGKRRNSENG